MADKPKNKGGRPPIVIDYDAVERLGQIQCTQEEIANVLNISLARAVHDDKFVQAHRKGMEVGKASLRRQQFKGAEQGNATMLVWLGKQYLGQSDKIENRHSVIDGQSRELSNAELDAIARRGLKEKTQKQITHQS